MYATLLLFCLHAFLPVSSLAPLPRSGVRACLLLAPLPEPLCDLCPRRTALVQYSWLLLGQPQLGQFLCACSTRVAVQGILLAPGSCEAPCLRWQVALPSYAGKGQAEHRVRRQPAQAKQMPISKKVEQRIWPYLSPYADPVIEKVESSSYYKAAVNHLKPIAANGM